MVEKPKILYEDKYLIVADKPAGMLSYPIPGKNEVTIGEALNSFPVHRLDRDTSGIIILAKDEKTKEDMQKIFAKRNVKKEYVALVWGKIEPEEGEIIIPLARGTKDRLKVVPSSSGRVSHTTYKVIRYHPEADMSLLCVGLKTGRTHQIRVHMNAIGHPIVGDLKYTKRKSNLKRQFLHAEKIEFLHPKTGKMIKIQSTLPNDLSEYLSSIY